MTPEEIKELQDKLLYTRKNVYQNLDEQAEEEMNVYAEGYKTYLDLCKTEREAVLNSIQMAEACDFRPYTFGMPVKAGDKFYYNNRDKELLLFVIGTDSMENGIRIAASHIDSPRIDLKQHPVYEEGNMGFFKTHYYGGIKKYQWVATPLAIHGRIVRADGSFCDIVIGEEEGDPVFYINDLLPHLAKDQMSRTMGQGIPGEKLNILIGSKPLADGKDIKLALLKLLNEKYGIIESDFISAELSIVPAFKSRDIGFDRSMIGGYGHDDRVCSYPALTAILAAEEPKNTLMVILADKEETGSGGKNGTNDSTAEFVGYVRKIFDDAGITWQTGELGKVDQGGGGTVAVYIAEKGIDVVDLGVPVISMHAPYEVISKADLFMTYKALFALNEA